LATDRTILCSWTRPFHPGDIFHSERPQAGDTAVDVASWLRDLGLERYEATFRENDVDAELLPNLTADDLKDLGITSVGHRRRLLEAIDAMRLEGTQTDAAQLLSIPSTDPVGRVASSETAGERRHLTVMFCDLVGSTALSEKLDPEELRSLLHAYRTVCGDVIARYDGFVARYVGDGILTYFGWPTAHEDDAERAARAALEIVHSVKRASSAEDLSVRIGIATGPVVVGETAGTGDQSKLAVGSTPNLAARLQGLAGADQVVIATSTRRLTGSAFELTDLGEVDLKGTSEPVHAWRVERALVTESRFDANRGGQALTPLVGRDEELDLLLRRWSQAKDGEGQVVLLSGEPGIGKSRILNALRKRLDARGVQPLRFQCSPYYVNSPFWPIVDNFERTLKFARDETSDAKLDKIEALVVTQYGLPRADVRFVASILSIPCEERYGTVSMTPQKHKDETLRTLVDISEAAALQHPSVMLFEDAHWADPTTLEVLDLLIDRVRSVPLLVVLTHRPEFQSRWSGQGHVGALNLSKLTRTQSGAMVSALAGGKALPGPLIEQILTRTDGVPLFVEELTKSILESGELTEVAGHYEYGISARTLTIPATLRDSLMARLDRFIPVKEIAQIGAAIGREFSYELIAAAAAMPQAQLDDSLARLTESGLAFRRGTPPDAVYTFKHGLVQDAAYDSLLKSRRQELHGKIAYATETKIPNMRIIEPEVLAHHFTEAGVAEAAIPLWQAAGELALKRTAPTEAISHFNRALRLLATLPGSGQRDASELDLRSRLAGAWVALKGWATPEVWTSVYPALALAQSLERGDALAPILWGLATNVMARGRVAEALPRVEEMLEAAKEVGDATRLATGHALACACYCYAGEFTKVLEHVDKVLDFYDGKMHYRLENILNIDAKTQASVWGSISTWMLGYPDRSFSLANEKDVHARRQSHPFELGFALATGTHWFDDRFTHDDIRERAEECERLGRVHSLPVQWAMMALGLYGLALIREGKPAEAIDPLKGWIGAWEASGGRVRLPTMKAFLAEALALTGDFDKALHLVDEIIAHIERPGWGERLHYAEVLRLKGWILSLKGDLEGAERNFLASLDWARRQQAKSWELRTSTSLARLWQSQGKRHGAHELLAPVYGWFTEGFDTKDLLDAKSLLAELG
jgi:class 3 adenylate cyclase/tetratricopeptide (TPR) repeat protein